MSMTGLEAFDTTIQKTNEWLNDISKAEGSNDRHRAYLFLRATLHSARDRITNEEAVQLGAQLPMLVRGMYFEGWTLGEKKLRDRGKGHFLDEIRKSFPGDGEEEVVKGVEAVFQTLATRVSGGEYSDIRHQLPEDVRRLMPEAVV